MHAHFAVCVNAEILRRNFRPSGEKIEHAQSFVSPKRHETVAHEGKVVGQFPESRQRILSAGIDGVGTQRTHAAEVYHEHGAPAGTLSLKPIAMTRKGVGAII